MVITVLSMLILLGIVVLVHELGHFMAARLTGVKVEVFSIGFGKKIVKKEMMGTEFSIGLIPLGGYVKLAGENEYDKESQKPYHFQSKNRLQRFFVLFMGSFMNILLAFLILSFIYIVGKKVEKIKIEKPVIAHVSKDSTAEKAGIKVNDLILKVDDKVITNWKELQMAIASNGNADLPVEYQRDGKKFKTNIHVNIDNKTGIGDVGWWYELQTQISEVEQGSPAEKAGLKPNDIIVSIDGKQINFFQLNPVISGSEGKVLLIKIKRKNELIDFDIKPRKVEDRYLIGIMPIPYTELFTERYGVFKSVGKAFTEMYELVGAIFKAIKRIIYGKVSAKTISGPIAIAKYSKQTFKSGFSNFLMFIAFISLQLGIINLLPIPVLDGGHLMILFLEGLFRRDFNAKLKNILMYIGFFLLLTLMVFVILNDIAKELPNGWSSFFPF